MTGTIEPRRPAADAFAARRQALGLSRFRFAIHAGYSPSWIAMIERGYRADSDAAARIDRALSDLEAKSSARRG